MTIKHLKLAGLLCILSLFFGGGISAQALSTPIIIKSPPNRPIYDESQLFQSVDPALSVSSQVNAVMPLQDTLSAKSSVAYMHLDVNRFNIYLYNTLNQTSYRLASGVTPRINYSHTKIVFSSEDNNKQQIFTMNMDGSNQSLVVDFWPAYSPAWSLNGNQIVFVTTRDNAQGEIYIIGANGNGVKRITNNSVYDGMPSWSPDGKKIAYISYVNSQYRVWVMNTDGTGAVQVSQEAYSAHPGWSKDGSQIGYDADSDRDGWQELWVMNSDGSNRHQVYKPYTANTDVYMGSWNPGGSAFNVHYGQLDLSKRTMVLD